FALAPAETQNDITIALLTKTNLFNFNPTGRALNPAHAALQLSFAPTFLDPSRSCILRAPPTLARTQLIIYSSRQNHPFIYPYSTRSSPTTTIVKANFPVLLAHLSN